MNNSVELTSNQKHNSLLTVVIGIIVAIGRTKLNEQNEGDIVTIMAVVNVVALGFVLIILFNDIYNNVQGKITTYGTSNSNTKRMKIILEILFIILLCIFGLFGVRYVIEFRSTTFNDAMAIIALAISIANDGFVQCVDDPVYNFICILNKLVSNMPIFAGRLRNGLLNLLIGVKDLSIIKSRKTNLLLFIMCVNSNVYMVHIRIILHRSTRLQQHCSDSLFHNLVYYDICFLLQISILNLHW